MADQEAYPGVIGLDPIDASVHLAEIARSQVEHALDGRRRRLKVYESLKNLNEVIGTQYGDRVLFELVQNGHDAHRVDASDQPGEIAIRLNVTGEDHGELLVANRGEAFNASNLSAIRNIGTSDKRIGEGIGNKGLGFRSVEALTDDVRIYSAGATSGRERFNGYCFRFATPVEIETDLLGLGATADEAREVATTVPRYLVPKAVIDQSEQVAALAHDGFATVVALPLKSADAIALAERQVLALLDPTAPVLLFLDRIGALDIAISRPGASPIHHRSTRSTRSIEGSWAIGLELSEVRLDKDAFLLASSTMPKAPLFEAIRASLPVAPPLKRWLDWQGDAIVSVAVPLSGKGNAGRLYNFLPMTENAVAPIAGHIDAPFFADIDRRSMKPDLPLNKHLLETAAGTAARAALAIVDGAVDVPPSAVVDLVAWCAPHAAKLITAFRALSTTLEDASVWPIIAGGPAGWANFKNVFAWPEVRTGQMTPKRLAEVADAEILLVHLGDERIKRIEALARLVSYPLDLTAPILGDWAEAVADWLVSERKSSPTRWKTFLDDLVAIHDAADVRLALLEGRRILVDGDGKPLIATTKGIDGAPPVFVRAKAAGGSKRDGPPGPPAALKRKIRFLNDAVLLAEPTQRALEKAGLLRPYDPLDVLGALKGALDAEASEVQRRAALIWSFRVWRGGGGKPVEVALRAADLHVPTLGGWRRASEALFSGGWTVLGRTLEHYLVEAAPASADCAAVRERLLVAFADWPRASSEDRREEWSRFLGFLETTDGLPSLPAKVGRRGTPSGYWYGVLSTHSADKGLDRRWAAHVAATRFENPYADYDLGGDIWRLPGQIDHATLSAEARAALSDLIVTFLRRHGDEHFRFTIEHNRRLNRVELPTPLAVFLREAPWVASTRGDDITFATPGASWSSTVARQIPPRFVARFQTERGARADLPALLFDARIGLRDWSRPDSASSRLATLAASLEDMNAAERRDLRDQLRRAWSDVAQARPALLPDLTLVIDRVGGLASRSPNPADPPLIHVTNDMQGFAARALADRGEAVLDVGENDAAVIAELIEATPGFRARLADAGDVRLVVNGIDFEPSADDPLLATGSLAWLIDAAVLAHEYLGDPFELRTLPPDELERRLRQVRLRRCGVFALVIDGSLTHARGDERAQPVPHAKTPTLVLTGEGEIGLDLLCDAATALTKLLGARRNTLETMLERLERAGFSGMGAPNEDHYARAIRRDPNVIRDHFASTRGGVERRVSTLAPVVAQLGGRPMADALVEQHDRLGPSLDLRVWLIEQLGSELAELCIVAVDDTDDQRVIRRTMGFDFAAYARVLADLGYPPLNDEADFRRLFEVHMAELRPALLDRVRRRFSADWSVDGDLAPYVAARRLDFVTFDPTWTTDLETLDRTPVAARAAAAVEALLGADDTSIALVPLDGVTADNRKLILARHADLVSLVGAWCRRMEVCPHAQITETDPQALVRALDAAGLLDFEKLDRSRLPALYRRIGAWPAGMEATDDLERLNLVPADLEHEASEAREAKRKAEVARRTIPFGEHLLDAAADDFARVFEGVAVTAIADGEEWFTRSRTARLHPQKQQDGGGSTSSGKGGGQSWRSQPPDSVKTAMGTASEWLAREYLKRRFPKQMSDACWVSSNRAAFCTGGTGDDGLGYDFRVVTDRNEWLFEVKSAMDGGGEFELSARELEVAGSASLERKRRYRMLYVPYVFDPGRWRVLQLPNPAASISRDRFRVVRGGSVRYRFEQR